MANLPSDMPAGFPNHSAEQIERFVGAGTDTLRSFTADAKLSVRTPERSANLSADMQARRGDSLLVSVSGYGFTVAKSLVTPDSFFVHDRLGKRLVRGRIDEATALLPAPFAAADVFPALLGVGAFPTAPWRVTTDSLYYVLEDTRDRYRLLVDPRLWRVVRYEERSPDGSIVEDRSFTEFERIGGVLLPRRLLLRRPKEESAFSIYYKDLDLNPEGLSFRFEVGADVPRIGVEEL